MERYFGDFRLLKSGSSSPLLGHYVSSNRAVRLLFSGTTSPQIGHPNVPSFGCVVSYSRTELIDIAT
jgi:hypothetical protein